MRIVEDIKWGKLKRTLWDDELEQTSGEFLYNEIESEYVFHPDRCAFDNNQLIKIAKLIKKLNANCEGGEK